MARRAESEGTRRQHWRARESIQCEVCGCAISPKLKDSIQHGEELMFCEQIMEEQCKRTMPLQERTDGGGVASNCDGLVACFCC